MTDTELLNAIRAIIKEETSSAIKEEAVSLRRDIMHDTVVLMDAEFKPRFDLLSEELEIIKDRLPVADILDELQDELAAYRLTLRKHGREIQALQKAVNN